MEFKNLISLAKLITLVPTFILFCPVGLTIAFFLQRALPQPNPNDHFSIGIQIGGSLINTGILLYSVKFLMRHQKTWEDALLLRLSWLQMLYVIFGYLIYSDNYTSTQSLNNSIFIFLMVLLSFSYEGWLQSHISYLVKRK